MSTGLLFIILVFAGSLFVFWNRIRDDLTANQPYLYVLGFILATSGGVLLAGLYDQKPVVSVLVLLFTVWVLFPAVLLSWGTLSLLHGRFERALIPQRIVTWIVWSTVERQKLKLFRIGQMLDQGDLEEAQRAFEELERASVSSRNLQHQLKQIKLLLLGHRGDWGGVVRTYQQLKNRTPGHTWIPTFLFAARGFIEEGAFPETAQAMSKIEPFTLNAREELAVRTLRMAINMSRGEFEQGRAKLMSLREENAEFDSPFFPYWKARGLHAIQRYERARNEYERALKNVSSRTDPVWKLVIEDRLTELEMDRARRSSSSYVLSGQDLRDPVLEEPGTSDPETTHEAEPVIEEQRQNMPPPEVRDFIEKVNRVPKATVVLLVVIGFVFFSMMYLGLQMNYPEDLADQSRVSNGATDPVALLVFGMKADYMMNESAPTMKPSIRELQNQSSVELHEINYLKKTREKMNNTLQQNFSKEEFEKIWIEARKAHLFGYNEEGNIDYPKDQYWRLFTCTLLHIGWIHLLLNGYALWILGKLMENIYGWRDYLIIYLASGLTGSVASWKYGASMESAGASGAIFGLLGAAIALTLFKKEGMPEMIRNRLSGPLVFWTVVNLVLGFVMPAIDNAGHIGGLVGGLLIGYLISPGSDSSDSGCGVQFVKWSLFVVLVGTYTWAITSGVSFALKYLPRWV